MNKQGAEVLSMDWGRVSLQGCNAHVYLKYNPPGERRDSSASSAVLQVRTCGAYRPLACLAVNISHPHRVHLLQCCLALS